MLPQWNWLTHPPFTRKIRGSIPLGSTIGSLAEVPINQNCHHHRDHLGACTNKRRDATMYKGVVMTRGTGPYLAFRQCRTVRARQKLNTAPICEKLVSPSGKDELGRSLERKTVRARALAVATPNRYLPLFRGNAVRAPCALSQNLIKARNCNHLIKL